jgi:hypothetical protein
MNKADIFNGLFELVGAVLQWLNVRKLLRDREVKGVYWPITAFHVTWGAWNMYFYTSVDAPWSVAGASVLLAANMVWVTLAIMYRKKP